MTTTIAPGYVSISAIAVLESPRPINSEKGLRNIALDANFYVIEGSQTACIGLVRHFASETMAVDLRKIIEKGFQKALVIANISSISANTIPQNLATDEISDYAFVADVQQIVLLHDDTDAKISPHITVTGTISSFNTDDRTFTMSPSQYTVLQHTTSAFPIHAHFADPESKRWGDNGPKVTVGSTITFGGFLQRISREKNLDRTLSFSEIEVHNIAYLSNPNITSTPSKTTTSGSTSRRRWNYDELQNPSQQLSSQPSTNVLGKRKQEHQQDDDDKETKREKTVDNNHEIDEE